MPDGSLILAGKSEDAREPQPNPGEPFEDVYGQIYDLPRLDFKDVPAVPPHAPNMQGFIRNYAAQKDKPAEPWKIMESLTPKTLPVLSSLAHRPVPRHVRLSPFADLFSCRRSLTYVQCHRT